MYEREFEDFRREQAGRLPWMLIEILLTGVVAGKWDMVAVETIARSLHGRISDFTPPAQPATSDESMAALQIDADRWRALMRSQRIRVIGSAGFNHDDTALAGESYQHLSLELWTEYPGDHPNEGQKLLTEYADSIRRHTLRQEVKETIA